MKKYILLLFSVFAFGQASNQMVTFTEAQSLGFPLKSGQSHVTSNQCMTKSEALAKYNIDVAAMSSYANNQLVPRSAWVTGVIYYTYNITQGYVSPNQVDATCGEDPRGDVIAYSSSSSISVPMNFYANTSLTTTFNGGNFKYYYAGTSELLTINNTGAVTSITSCIDTIPPTQPTSLTGSINRNNDVTLTWVASTDNVGVTGYKIYRNGGLLFLVNNVTTYNINNECGGTHNYSIEAFDAAGNVSAPSHQSNSIYSSNPYQCFN